MTGGTPVSVRDGVGARALIPFAPFAAVSIAHSILVAVDHPLGGFATKQLLMPALALAAVWTLRGVRPWPRAAMSFVLAALALSWIGDGAGLFFPGLPTLPTMILFFGLAHICYMLLFWRAPGIRGARRPPVWVLVYVAWWGVTVAVVGPPAGSLLIPLAVYGLVLGGTAALSTRFGPLVSWGGALFLCSDTLIALREFLAAPGWVGDLIMPSYALGQGLIVYGTVRILRRGAVPRATSEAGEAAR